VLAIYLALPAPPGASSPQFVVAVVFRHECDLLHTLRQEA
jgi:hypothetical protein